MIKLKSLFRRGQGNSSSSSSSAATGSGGASSKKHSNNNRSKSQSTTSLNTAVENEQQQQQQQQKKLIADITYYDSQPSSGISERGVDVGNELGLTNRQTGSDKATATIISTAVQSNTLPQQKKLKGAQKKGHKQPKLLPTANLPPTEQQPQYQSTVPHNNTVTNQTLNSSDEFVKLSQASAVIAPSLQQQQQQQQVGAAPLTTSSIHDGIGKAMSTTAAAPLVATATASYEHQQQQLLEATAKMQELQLQLDHEKLVLESRISELLPYQSEVAVLKIDMAKLEGMLEKSEMEVANLKYENESLRTRLHDVVNSPLSDAEKHQLIQDSQRLHSSAPASIALPNTTTIASTPAAENDNAFIGASGTPCLTPDWDKHSSSSEISVACLQDKIIQMEETHYSTNEELQATLQELADLQSQLGDAQTENERLAEEKDVLFQSLCRQTEKLNEARTQNTTLQDLLLRDAKQQEICTSEREKKLLDLIKTSQEEREVILVKQEELNAELQELRQSVDLTNQENVRFKDRIAMLDSTVDATNAERKQMETELAQAKEDISQGAIEISRLSTLLENARSKIEELEQDLARGDKTDLSDVLDAARKEKDMLEERVAELQDQCSRNQAEIRRLKDQLSGLTEECKVAKNNAKCAVSDLEYRLEQLQQEKDKLYADYQQLNENSTELQVQCKCHQEDKTQLQNLLSETQKHLGDVERKLKDTEQQLEKEVQLRQQEAEEWQQFQSDLLMTVRVANDFKTEALTEREQLVIDNKTQKEKIRLLEQQLEKLTKQQIQQNETQQSVLSTVQQEMASRRSKIASLNRQDSRLSVKTLIETIENNKQSAKLDEGQDDNSAINQNGASTPEAMPTVPTGILPTVLHVGNNGGGSPHTNEWPEDVRLTTVSNISNSNVNTNSTTTALNTKGPLREQQQQQTQQQPTSPLVSSIVNSKSALLGNNERKDPLNMLAKNGGSKRNALLKWCQNKTVGYRNIDITNFSSSWNDGLAFCAILHSYLPDHIPYDTLSPANKRRNFSLAFAAAESVGILTTLNINDMCQIERPDWTQVMSYVTAIYKHFET